MRLFSGPNSGRVLDFVRVENVSGLEKFENYQCYQIALSKGFEKAFFAVIK